jgi:mRNA interferase RelE/StbE
MSSSGAATQICSHRFDKRFFNFSADVQRRIQAHIDELGRNLLTFSHYKMQGVDAFRLRVGDYRIVYQFDARKNELHLIAVGHRRDVYKPTLN